VRGAECLCGGTNERLPHHTSITPDLGEEIEIVFDKKKLHFFDAKTEDMIRNFSELLSKAKKSGPKRISVAAAEDRVVVEAMSIAKKEGVASGILVGNKNKIEKIAKGIQLRDFEIVDVKDETEAVREAVSLVRNGSADILMKGFVPTNLFLKGVLDKENGLRTDRVLSHCAVLEVPSYPKLLFLTDGGMCIRPDLQTKLDIIKNAADLAHSLGIKRPKVAILAAVETVSEKMEETIHAAEICKLWERNQLRNMVVDGPLALDIAISKEAAEHKKIKSLVAGDADILVVPDVAAGNIFAKGMIWLAGAKASGLVLGASSPCVLLSRADTPETKLYSIALGVVSSSEPMKPRITFTPLDSKHLTGQVNRMHTNNIKNS